MFIYKLLIQTMHFQGTGNYLSPGGRQIILNNRKKLNDPTFHFCVSHATSLLIVSEIKGRWPLVPRRQGYIGRIHFETTVN